MNGGLKGKGGGFLGKPSFMPWFESKVSRGEFTQWSWERARGREGGVKRGNRNNSKQTQREKDREGEANRSFYFEGRNLAVKLK